ncbi:type I-E CRISPR-associated protein Cas5/CasD [Nocardiopsis halophila]|uniref:type I-E CRISPR-associated protein Cas5/CasD n=1 Tax=Nocardiopsis halophila TaxID=141692 RepID=UPI0003495EDB|nr:type I-E CRISPR-associated protein Cas5/CasD [Nocardiopsis halophila]
MADAVLALRFDAPMQSWGVRSRFTHRDTAQEPTKSGVVGLLGSAAGVERTDRERLADLASLRMAVRVDREGIVERDYQVTTDVPTTRGTGHRNVVSHRYYLADALFLVLLQGELGFLERLAAAVRRPHWPLFFGRRAHVPASPLIIAEERGLGTGIRPEGTLEEALREHPWQEEDRELRGGAETDPLLRAVVEVPAEHTDAEARYDVPVTFESGNREFRQRYVRVCHVPIPGSREGGAA